MNARERRLQLLPFIWTPEEDPFMKGIDKHTFKVCESVALGLTHYYMGPRDKRKLTAEERAEAMRIIPKLPEGWMGKGCKMPWSCTYKKARKK